MPFILYAFICVQAVEQAREEAASLQGEHSDRLQKLLEAKKSLEDKLAEVSRPAKS